MRRTTTVAVSISTVLAATLALAPSATADQFDNENLYSMEACYAPWNSKFKFHLYYNSGMDGAYRNIGYSVYNFDQLRPGGSFTGYYPLKFCVLGAGGATPGSGQRVKNNAASGENDHYKYTARVYFESGYNGAQDVMGPYQHIARFPHVYNENASFKWT
jgi:hypothetical protein